MNKIDIIFTNNLVFSILSKRALTFIRALSYFLKPACYRVNGAVPDTGEESADAAHHLNKPVCFIYIIFRYKIHAELFGFEEAIVFVTAFVCNCQRSDFRSLFTGAVISFYLYSLRLYSSFHPRFSQE